MEHERIVLPDLIVEDAEHRREQERAKTAHAIAEERKTNEAKRRDEERSNNAKREEQKKENDHRRAWHGRATWCALVAIGFVLFGATRIYVDSKATAEAKQFAFGVFGALFGAAIGQVFGNKLSRDARDEK